MNKNERGYIKQLLEDCKSKSDCDILLDQKTNNLLNEFCGNGLFYQQIQFVYGNSVIVLDVQESKRMAPYLSTNEGSLFYAINTSKQGTHLKAKLLKA